MSPPSYPASSSSPPSGPTRIFSPPTFSTHHLNSRPLSEFNGFSPSKTTMPVRMPVSTPIGGAKPSASKPLAHISDLQADAVKRLSPDNSLSYLVSEAQQSLASADTLLSFRRPDLAYKDYLRAFEIVANIIPRHPDHPSLTGKRGAVQQTHTELLRRINAKADQYESIKNIIINDNKRNATQPASQSLHRSASVQAHDDLDRSIQPATSRHHYSSSASQPSQYTHHPPHPSAPAAEALNERFARLRMLPSSDAAARIRRPDSRTSNASTASVHSSFDSLTPATSDASSSHYTSKPTGPRAMPNGSLRPLDTSFASAMPKAPSPIYSPARNMQIAGNIDLPRTSARSIVGTGGRSNSAMSSASSYAPGNEGDDSSGYFPRMSLDGPPPAPPRRKSVHVPKEIRIGPEKLYDYLKMHNILLIDVRSREDFDDGHIFTQSIINIDPTCLRRDMSADDLQDSLVLSPENEQAAFSNRNAFDLVVYYDQATASDRFLKRPSTDREFKLRYLYDALYEFNQDKPLQRPPILLMGGIEAWTELVGDQALMTSNTASKNKPARPLRRVPVATNSSTLTIPKRRREYNPLDADEERKWLERARVESVVVDQKPPMDDDDESRQVEDATPFFETIDEFNRRFPDAGHLDQHNAGDSADSELFLPPMPRVPSYPTPPRSSSVARAAPPAAPPKLPTVPSRPAPALSRMSYSGVSDRAVSQSAQNTGSSDLPAYVSPRLLPSNVRLPRTGLVNFGVTCYMNATIQALSATTPLTLFFLDDRFKQCIQRDNWKGSKGVLPELYSNLIRSVWKGDVDAIRPSTLRSFCARLNSEWGIDRQQDAKEFFDFLVDCLHEDLNANWSRTPLKALTDQQEEFRESLPKSIVSKTEWGRYTHRERSYLTELFGGQHASRLRCTTCHFTSTTYEAFYSISVEIPRSGKTTIQECLKSYCAEEMLSGDEVWKCPRCKKEREATKQITITRAPQFLVVHFKRFSAGRGQSARKISTPIDFPLRNLNFEPYMLPSPGSKELQDMSKNFSPDQLKPDPSMSPPYLYDAYAVMRHIGSTLTSGHYTCLAKDRGRNCWRQFNDTRIADFDPDRLPERDRLQNEMAYIVFYQRVSEKS